MSPRHVLQTLVIALLSLVLVACSAGGPLVRPGPTIASGKLAARRPVMASCTRDAESIVLIRSPTL